MARHAWDVTGYRVFYQIGVEERWFEVSGRTPYEAVFYSDFESFIERISIKKARI